MFSYHIRRTHRRFRAAFIRARSQGYFEREKIFRVLGCLVVFITTISTTSQPIRQVKALNKNIPQTEGTVAGAETEPPARFAIPEYPQRIPDSPGMGLLTAQAALILDGETGKTLYEKNSHQRLAPASLTKIMTALVSLEKYALDENLTVPEVCLVGLEGRAQMGLTAKEVLQVETLLYGLLLNSAADAACVLARGAQTETEFIEMMNQKANTLGLTATHFTNPVGFDGENHYSSAWDMLTLARAAMKNPIFRKIVGTSELKVHDYQKPPTRWHNLKNTNTLLKEATGITGVKTGRTAKAGECFLASWIWEKRELFGVVLGSEDRFLEIRKLQDWIGRVYQSGP